MIHLSVVALLLFGVVAVNAGNTKSRYTADYDIGGFGFESIDVRRTPGNRYFFEDFKMKCEDKIRFLESLDLEQRQKDWAKKDLAAAQQAYLQDQHEQKKMLDNPFEIDWKAQEEIDRKFQMQGQSRWPPSPGPTHGCCGRPKN